MEQKSFVIIFVQVWCCDLFMSICSLKRANCKWWNITFLCSWGRFHHHRCSFLPVANLRRSSESKEWLKERLARWSDDGSTKCQSRCKIIMVYVMLFFNKGVGGDGDAYRVRRRSWPDVWGSLSEDCRMNLAIVPNSKQNKFCQASVRFMWN